MISTIKKYEVQVDEKPSGVVLRVNDANRCILRICRIPRELVFDEQGNLRDFIDITYPTLKISTSEKECEHPLHNRQKGNQCGTCGRYLPKI